MAEYVQINLLDMLETLGEDECMRILSSFVCPLNSDVEDFARNKAVEFTKQRIAITYLVFVYKRDEAKIVGSDLLDMALERVREVEHLIGGKTVYIECNNQPKLYEFYSEKGFIAFNERFKEKREDDELDLLIQMLKIF